MSRFKKILTLILLSGFLLAPVLTFAQGNARFAYTNTGTTTPPSTESASKFNDSGGCDLIMYIGNNVFVSCTAARISAFLLSLAADLLYRAGTMFDFSINYSLNMAARLGEYKFVSNGWGVLRDVTNLAYIFILLYISINIILGNSGYGDKSLIAKVLITAVFVNFSLFGAKVIIDVTNIGALQFYNLITPASSSDSRTKNTDSNVKGLTGQFMKLFNLQSIYGNDEETSADDVLNSVAKSAGGAYDQSETWWKMVKLSVFGILFIIAVTVVFAAGAILFLSRTITLFFLMLFASLAVASRALPATKGQFDSWLKKLINNSIFAPIFLGLIYIFVSATNNDKNGGNLAYIILNGGNISAIVTFFMYLAFLVGLLLVAKQLGIKGGDAAHGFADKWLSPKSIGNRALGGAKMIGNRALGGAKMIGKGALTVGKGAVTRTLGAGATAIAESRFGRTLAGFGVPMDKVAKATGVEALRSKNEARKDFISGVTPQGAGESNEDFQKRRSTGKKAGQAYVGIDEKGKPVGGIWNGTKDILSGFSRNRTRANMAAKIKTDLKTKGKLDKELLAHARALGGLLSANSNHFILNTTGNAAVDDQKILDAQEVFINNGEKALDSSGHLLPGLTVAAGSELSTAATDLATARTGYNNTRGATQAQIAQLKTELKDAQDKFDKLETKLKNSFDNFNAKYDRKQSAAN